MRVGRDTIKVITLDLELSEATTLMHVLQMRSLDKMARFVNMQRQVDAGTLSGTGVMDDLAFIDELSDKLKPWIERFQGEL